MRKDDLIPNRKLPLYISISKYAMMIELNRAARDNIHGNLEKLDFKVEIF